MELLASTPAPAPAAENQGSPELDHAFALVCLLSGIEVHEIEYTETEAIYNCSQAGKHGGEFDGKLLGVSNVLEIKYTLAVALDEMNEPSYDITYTPNEDAATAKILAKLPDYFGEPLSFMSDAVC